MTQKEIVLQELKKAGEQGVHSFWGYKNYIPRLGSIICKLKHEGYFIVSLRDKHGRGTTYTLVEFED